MLPTQMKSPQFKNPANKSNVFHYDEEYLSKESEVLTTFHSKYEKYNCSKKFLRPTVNIFPKNKELLKTLSIPIGLNISPISQNTLENEIPVVNYGEKFDIPRCKNEKCKAFFNPFIKFLHGCGYWQCNFCKKVNYVESYYYSGIDKNGIRLDQETKEELNYGSYEFIANSKYCCADRKPNTPNYYFLIDISLSAVNTGFTQCVLETIKDSISNDYFYNYENFDIKVCIITYDTSIHFYSVNNNSNQFSMYCVNDNEIFIPTYSKNLLLSLKDYKSKLIQIIESIQNNINNNNNLIKDATKIFDAIKAAYLIGNHTGGKILLFNGSNIKSLPIMNDQSVINENSNDKNINKNYLRTDGRNLGKLGIEITFKNYSVYVFHSTNEYTNILTLNQICDNSNGNLFYYKKFSPDLHYKNIYNQIKRILTNEIKLESTYFIRFSHGFYIDEYVTSVLLYDRRLFVFPIIDADQKYTICLDMDQKTEIISKDNENENLTTMNDDYVFIQSSFLYSHGDGTRRVRINNLCIPVSTKPKEIYDSIDIEFLAAFYLQNTIHNLYKEKNLINTVTQTEKNFFQLINAYFNTLNTLKKELSDNLNLLLIYVLGMFKLCLIDKNEKGYKNDVDLSNYYRLRLMKCTIEEILSFIYPRIYLLDNILGEEIPEILNCTISSFDKGFLYLIDNGFSLFLYCKKNIENKMVFDLFGAEKFELIDYNNVNENNVFDEDKDMNNFKNKIIDFIENIRGGKTLYQDLFFIFEGVNEGNIMKDILIEDNYNKSYPYDYNKFYEKNILNLK